MLDLGSYQTAWTRLHRYRVAMGTTGTAQLAGALDVDESFLRGHKVGLRGRGALGKAMVGIAVELVDPEGFGRARIKVLPNARTLALERFLLNCVEPDSLIVTDGLSSYRRGDRGPGLAQAVPGVRVGVSRARTAARPPSIASCPCSNAGCWALTRGPSPRGRSRPTWTSSCSASTAGTRVSAACGPSDCCRPPSARLRRPTGRWSWTRSRRRCRPRGASARSRCQAPLIDPPKTGRVERRRPQKSRQPGHSNGYPPIIYPVERPFVRVQTLQP